MMQNAEPRTPNANWELQTEGNEENIEHRTPNAEHRTPNTEHRTPNIEHRTSNVERRMGERKKQPPMSNEFRFNDVTFLTI
jgi:hypothetical protein